MWRMPRQEVVDLSNEWPIQYVYMQCPVNRIQTKQIRSSHRFFLIVIHESLKPFVTADSASNLFAKNPVLLCQLR